MPVVTKVLLIMIFWIALNDFTSTTALKDVYLALPKYVKSGDNAVLTCNYNLEHDTLYAIVWYKDNREFYRFTPKDLFNVKTFKIQNDVDVDKSHSTANSVALSSLNQNSSGIYTCVVDIARPDYNLAMDSDRMEVVDVPDAEPKINADVTLVYKEGDYFEANCTIDSSPSVVNLTWLINGRELLLKKQTDHLGNTYFIKTQPHSNDHKEVSVGQNFVTADKNRVTIYLKLMLELKHFIKEQLTLECRAKTFNIFERTTQLIVLLDTTSNKVFVFTPPMREAITKGAKGKSYWKSRSGDSHGKPFGKTWTIVIIVGVILSIVVYYCCRYQCNDEDEPDHR